MVTVPRYEPSVSLNPLHQRGYTTRASAEDFGAAAARGMGDLASGVSRVAQAKIAVQEMEGEAEVKQRDKVYTDWRREAMYGENGYLNLEGEAAVKGREAFEKADAEKRQELGAGLTGFAAQKWSEVSSARASETLDTAIRHQSKERKTWMETASADRLTTFSNDALAAYTDPKKVDFNIQAGLAEIRSMAELKGLDEDSLAQRESEFISSVRKNIGLRMMADDPMAAAKYYEEHKVEFTGVDQAQFEETLEVPLATAQAAQFTNDFFSGGADTGYYDAIKAAESGGAVDAKNPNSTATGLYQFIESTWNSLVDRYPSLGLTRDGRNDPAQQEIAIRVFTKENAGALARGGIEVTNGTLYAAHFLGAGGAVQVLRSDPNALVSDIVSPGVIAANSFLRGMTVAQFAAWAERKGGGSGAPDLSGGVPSYNKVEAYLATIEDPTVRDATRKSIYATMDGQEKARKQERTANFENAYSMMITQGISPFTFPPETQAAIGIEGMSSLMTYWEKTSGGQKIVTDDRKLYDLQTLFATDPQKFAEQDLFEFRPYLSDSDWEKVNGWRQTALTDMKKASDEGSAIISTSEYMKTQLEAVGISATGKRGREREEAVKREAEFQLALQREVDAFIEANSGVRPNPSEVQSIINRLLLPVVIKQPGALWGESETPSLMFEFPKIASGMREGTSVFIEYADIPEIDRQMIKMDFEKRNGYKPSDEQVEAIYSEMLTQQIDTGN